MSHSSKASPSEPYVPDITLDRSSPVPLYFQISEPIAVLTNLIPADIAPTMQELESNSLYDMMRERGVTLASARQVIGARTATAKEAKLLSEHRGAALLTTQRTTYDPSGRVVEYGDHIYRASRYSFEASLFAQ